MKFERAAFTSFLLVMGSISFAEYGNAAEVEQYRMNLGGPSGQYTDWERSGIRDFAALRATIEIQKTHGRARDKWASLARVNLSGPKDASGEAAMMSVVFHADRRNGEIVALFHQVDAQEPIRLEFDGQVRHPIQIGIRKQSDQRLELRIGPNTFGVDLPEGFEVSAISAVGSGVDARFEPFEITRD